MQIIRKKTHKGRLSFSLKPHQTLFKGQYASVALESCRIKDSQIKAAELALKRTLKKNGEFWIRIQPNIPVSGKLEKVRMGKGKGNFKHLISRVTAGTILFELQTNEILARQAFKIASSKLPLKLNLVSSL